MNEWSTWNLFENSRNSKLLNVSISLVVELWVFDVLFSSELWSGFGAVSLTEHFYASVDFHENFNENSCTFHFFAYRSSSRLKSFEFQTNALSSLGLGKRFGRRFSRITSVLSVWSLDSGQGRPTCWWSSIFNWLERRFETLELRDARRTLGWYSRLSSTTFSVACTPICTRFQFNLKFKP